MKQFIDKLIERLEEEVTATKTKCSVNVEFDIGIYKSIEIVNQLAEEHINSSTDTSTDLAIVQSLPSLYPLQAFEEEAVHRVVEMAKSSNIQTIDVSELLGESEQGTKSIEYINHSSNYEKGYEDCWNDCMETIQASAPYQPKGE